MTTCWVRSSVGSKFKPCWSLYCFPEARTAHRQRDSDTRYSCNAPSAGVLLLAAVWRVWWYHVAPPNQSVWFVVAKHINYGFMSEAVSSYSSIPNGGKTRSRYVTERRWKIHSAVYQVNVCCHYGLICRLFSRLNESFLSRSQVSTTQSDIFKLFLLSENNMRPR